MDSFIAVTIVFAVIAVKEIVPAWKARQWNVLAVGLLFALSAYGILVAASFGHYPPAPLRELDAFVKSLTQK